MVSPIGNCSMVPNPRSPILRDLVTAKVKPEFKCLALKILLGRLQLSTRFDSSEANISAQISALHEFLIKNEGMAKADLEMLAATKP